MAALMESKIERSLLISDGKNHHSTDKRKVSSLRSTPNSISLDPINSTSDIFGSLDEGAEILTSPASDKSLKLSDNLAGRLQLDLAPPQSRVYLMSDDEISAISTPEAKKRFHFVEFEEVDSEQKAEFQRLLKKESGCLRSWLHKGLIVNIGFLVVMVIGIVLGEVFFPLEGVRGRGIPLMNDTACTNVTTACYTVRILRAIGIFGFLGGVTNWIAVEMLFRSVPFLFGSGVFAKNYKNIRERIRRVVVEILFNPSALKLYFEKRRKNLREIFQLENHFSGLLESDVTSKIIEKKINSILNRPEGFVFTMMGVNHEQLKSIMRKHIHSFIMEISPNVLDKISSSGLADGVGLQAEVERILEEKMDDLTAEKVKQIMSIMIRKHLNWLIVWGNILGALAGLLAEIIAIVVARYTDT